MDWAPGTHAAAPAVHGGAAVHHGARLVLLQTRGIRGKQVTPFLLDHFHTATAGESLRVNIRVVERNAALAADIALACAASRRAGRPATQVS